MGEELLRDKGIEGFVVGKDVVIYEELNWDQVTVLNTGRSFGQTGACLGLCWVPQTGLCCSNLDRLMKSMVESFVHRI